ncbi:TPA: hypothetical protein DIU27_01210 [Candidatus Collierbacteria bacterium]|uniref:Lipoprotein n=1 Tax=Candidatus Collierbacteria bacterium GW2011_GWB2_44_22 TaxID=1618387 RepID=A0A0G1HW58_9BACT|nr:MAG: hypothetical protein UW31_C0012G0029 [Candidatus Collierbacteria bacterium GW2011_GWA2_44_13]KKT51155.1 MAG: hypothetical protein UW44_C0015G0026 [Candidatus Collierbacteria bacterium GW2011_GWB2_44_22]KKT64117.1 MAG: hypothetical protein UW58_C0050G0012 [Candidatus Collierbacteria bacterium GW2011_GWC2_44_30]KKT68219.1 MAG: hypothetical protein UW64_C0026G0008 [Microgenomates group bacterium GW2011_GWC1_44_37]HCQ30990.1 hypothetical protein [Candidatus Collierbacteria bacterium]
MRKPFGLFVLLIVLSLSLGACGPKPFEIGSLLVCPKNYDPATSVCTEKKSANEKVDSEHQELPAAKLGVDEVGVYRVNTEMYGIYERVGYHPTPSDYVRVYSRQQIHVVSDIDPNACGGSYNDFNCVKALSNVTLKGYQKFGASYALDVSMDFSSQQNLRLLYEVGGAAQLMVKFNDRSRDTLRDSTDIDPQKYISGEIKKPDVARIWLSKLESSDYMTSWQYFRLFKFEDLAVRYFEPEKNDSASSSQVLEDQEFQDFLRRRDLFCAQYEPGTSLRAECDRTFVCSQTDNVCYFGGAIIPIDQLPTATPTVTP